MVGKQPFAGLVFEALVRRSAELGRCWAELDHLLEWEAGGEPSAAGRARTSDDAGEQLVRTLVDAAADGGTGAEDSLVHAGGAMGKAAHRRSVSLPQMLTALDVLTATLLRAAERAAADHAGASGEEGFAIAGRIIRPVALLRLAATAGYTQAAGDELRERFRAIRHDLRNPLGTLKSAVALLTDESMPAEMRESSRVKAMVARSARSLDEMIDEALGDAAARLPVSRTPDESPADSLADWSVSASGREQRDDVARGRQRPDLESGAL